MTIDRCRRAGACRARAGLGRSGLADLAGQWPGLDGRTVCVVRGGPGQRLEFHGRHQRPGYLPGRAGSGGLRACPGAAGLASRVGHRCGVPGFLAVQLSACTHFSRRWRQRWAGLHASRVLFAAGLASGLNAWSLWLLPFGFPRRRRLHACCPHPCRGSVGGTTRAARLPTAGATFRPHPVTLGYAGFVAVSRLRLFWGCKTCSPGGRLLDRLPGCFWHRRSGSPAQGIARPMTDRYMTSWRDRCIPLHAQVAVVCHDLLMVWICWQLLRAAAIDAARGARSTAVGLAHRGRPGGSGPGLLAGRPVSRPVAFRQRPRPLEHLQRQFLGDGSRSCWPWPWTASTACRCRCWWCIRCAGRRCSARRACCNRAWRDYQVAHSADVNQRVLILGAGRAAEALVRDLRRTGAFLPVGFLDDASQLHGAKIQGLPVLGSTANAPSIARETAAKLIIIAIPSLDAAGLCSGWWRSATAPACHSAWCRS